MSEQTPNAPECPFKELLIQPFIEGPCNDQFFANHPCPAIDEDFIGKTVGSKTKRKRRVVVNHHRDYWNSLYGTKVVELQHERRLRASDVKQLAGQLRQQKIAFALTQSWTWFAEWPAWSAFLFKLLYAVAGLMMGASSVGVFKLLQNTAVFADSKVSCAVVATLAGASVFGVKSLFASIKDAELQNRLRIAAALLTGVLAVTYFVLVSFMTGGLGAPVLTVDQIANSTGSTMKPWLSPHMQLVQLLLEMFASLSAFLYSEIYVERHGSPKLSQNPKKIFRAKQRDESDRQYQLAHHAMGRCDGNRRGLLYQRKSYVASAVASFERKFELARLQEEGIRRQRGDAGPDRPPSFFSRFANLFKKQTTRN